MKAEMRKTVLCLVMVAMLINMAKGANHTVGDPNGRWDQFTDLRAWASSKTFSPGDNLFFQYSSFHNLLEVSKADYDSCATSNPLNPPYTGGLTVIPLTSPGKRYFICGIPGHCTAGMKVEINTNLASALTPAAYLPSPSPLAYPVSSPSPSPMPLQSLSPTSNALPSATALHPTVSLPDTPLSSANKINVVVGSSFTIAFGFMLML